MRAICSKTRLVPVCLVLLISGCVTRKSANLNESKPAQSEIKAANLSDYIRTLYKLSSEASKHAEERSTLLSQAPELELLLAEAEESPKNTAARDRVVSEYMSRHLYWGAYELLTNTLPDRADDPAINMNLAIIWDAWGQYDLAKQYGDRAIANGLETSKAFETMGQIALHQNEPDQAIAWYQRSLKQSRTASALANLGYAYMLKSEWASSKGNLEEALAFDDTLYEVHNNLAIVLSKTGDDTGALAHLMQTGRPAVAFNNLGVLYLDERKLPEAQHYFEEALRLEPSYEIARRNLNGVQAKLSPIQIPDLSALIDTSVRPMAQLAPAVAQPVVQPQQDEVKALEKQRISAGLRTQKIASSIKPASVNSPINPPTHAQKISSRVQGNPATNSGLGDYRGIAAGLAGLALVAGLLIGRLRKSRWKQRADSNL